MENVRSLKKNLRRIICIGLVLVCFSAVFSSEQFGISAGADVHSRAALSSGQQNIVKRAYQMTNIKWSPKKDVYGWNGDIIYTAGKTYTGLPYGQPVYASYVPWATSLEDFISAVNNKNSKMYTDFSSYNKRAPYYSVDCSAFVSWAWGLNSRQTTRGIRNYSIEISRSSFANAEVGDCLCLAGNHVVLITDITYDSQNRISSIEISEATTNKNTFYCCQKIRYGEGGRYSLEKLSEEFFGKGYILYRSKTRDKVTYTHSCVVPLQGDRCEKCNFGYENLPCEHSFTGKVTKAAACTANGIKTYTCSKCNDFYTESIPSYGHSFSGKITKAATCTASGTKTYTCSKCNDFYTENIPPHGHSFKNGYCAACGIADPSVKKPGDVDGDGEVTAADARLILRAAVGLENFSAEIRKLADVNRDNSIDASDARLVLRASVGLEILKQQI